MVELAHEAAWDDAARAHGGSLKTKVRQIVVDGTTYFYRVTWRTHLADRAAMTYAVRYRFAAYRFGQKASPLEIIFETRDDVVRGGPLHQGDQGAGGINLNKPREAAELVRIGIARGWRPDEAKCAFRVVGDDQMLEVLRLPDVIPDARESE